jgi:signal transduction histidine kinase/ActR/RegA family two-component response regulator
VFNMISASRRTEELLQELRRSNTALESRSQELEEKASLLEVKNREIAEASDSLEEKAKQLSLVSKYKSEFLANMSHELRTPLNSMLILSGLLSENPDGNLSEKQLEYVRTVHAAGKDLLALISQILDLSKIEAGKMQIERRSVSLSELSSSLERHFRPIAQQQALAFNISIAPDVPAQITTDPQRVEQVLKNLLSNAFKFTERGHVDVEVRMEPERRLLGAWRPESVVAISVVDTGIGIPADKQQLIFEAFQQADASTSRNYGGTGLGLTISREIARLLGGEIHLRSAHGAGSTFTLFLPLVPAERPSDQITAPAETPALPLGFPQPAGANNALNGSAVLVVDDDVRNLFAVTSLLEQRGAEVLAAGSCDEALALLQDHPDVSAVLMDIMMPEVDGYEATRRIHAQERFRNLPVIALTAKAMPGDRERCLEAGCVGFVPKPVEASALEGELERAISKGNTDS